MTAHTLRLFSGLTAALSLLGTPAARAGESWNPQAAASYLDQRADWWTGWPGAARDHGTVCISCHTAMPYLLARPALRAALHQDAAARAERVLLESITKRVRTWNQTEPFYSDRAGPNKAAQSRGAEAVLNAFILSARDAGTRTLSEDARTAFDRMWAQQRTAGDAPGSWQWLQFNNEPWEAFDSVYYGAALAAVAVGAAPENYRSTSGIQRNLALLREFLRHESAKQSSMNRVVLLWAAATWPGLLDSQEEAAIARDVALEQLADGGWDLVSLVWTWRNWNLRSLLKMWRSEDTPLEAKSDACATGLVAFVLELRASPNEQESVRRGLDWLARNQDPAKGLWRGYSLNRKREACSDTGLFMSDAATAYAVLALTARKNKPLLRSGTSR